MAQSIRWSPLCTFLYPPKTPIHSRLFSASHARRARPKSAIASLPRQPAQKSIKVAIKEQMEGETPNDLGLMEGKQKT